ncbi:cupin domain-containing protein [Halioxenophilus aromaticivorans]|uniref:dTDP-4-dehydrorhamnose 3,5-epimerase n=1 Tax=Halioxenophilus aromaticivorans TaxID=1306992 RepID=A0AAV3U5L1_9ALTE
MQDEVKKDQQSTDSEWSLPESIIDGVLFRETKNIITGNGTTSEGYREDWNLHSDPIKQIIQVTLRPGAISAWHMHRLQKDHVFVILGTFKLAMYDGRPQSPTYQKLEVRNLSNLRPGALVIPPGIWHGFKNLSHQESIFINYFDRAYQYSDPDEYRLPPDTTEIPFTF